MPLESIYGKRKRSFFQVETILIEYVRKAGEEEKNTVHYQQVSEMKIAILQFEVEFED